MVSHSQNAPTIDKIIPGLGYTKDNVDIICRSCNTKKQDATADEHEAFACRQREVANNRSLPKPNGAVENGQPEAA
jgi:hypothetical protein